jgi:hypothetical protein
MGGSGGGKTSTSTQSSEFAPQLMSLYRASRPTLDTLSSQTAEGLQTGSVNAQIPSVNASVAAARQAYSTSTQSLKNQLSEGGLANSSFGQQLLGENAEEGGQSIAAIPSDVTNAFLGKAVPTVANAGTGALNTAASLDTSSWSTPSFMQYFMQGLGATSQGVGAGVGAYAAGGGFGSSVAPIAPLAAGG